MLFKSLNEALKQASEVRSLKLKIKDYRLPPEIFHFPQLQELYLEAPELRELPDELTEWHSLRLFEFKALRFKGSLTALFRLPSLQNLKLTQTPLHPLLLPLGHNTSTLTHLSLKEAQLKNLPMEFGQLNSLEELSLANNQLHELPMSFTSLKSLRRLNLDDNAFTTFPSVLAQLTNLRHVSIDRNSFSDDEKDRIFREHHLSVD